MLRRDLYCHTGQRPSPCATGASKVFQCLVIGVFSVLTDLMGEPDQQYGSFSNAVLHGRTDVVGGFRLVQIDRPNRGHPDIAPVFQQSAWTQHVIAPTRYRAGQQPSLLDWVITSERHFVDQAIINAPLGRSDHCVLTFDFICYRVRKPEPQMWIRNFGRADFSGMRIFLDQVKRGQASLEDLYGTIVQKIHEADEMFVPKNQHAVG
ncbi:hypothetical protein CLF_105623 [Clonorchis sinensis]|uniref:Endonuclease/exonuclease/phosphatase domain-containing protein n=1 Tax=Clonorchis sinensis TaxID=79923 RepID=H2KR75_CLOSI|nr:hypothetical protein CLF_105623 [Clonorchis sinensis]